jgi:RNA polymerase sigma factor (sigma-70 family)
VNIRKDRERRTTSQEVQIAERSDAELMQLVAGGEVSALGTLFDRHNRHALGLARRIVGEQVFAEEVVQEVFLAVLERAGSYDPARASVRSWLLSMVHHKAVDAVRREESLRRRADMSQRLDPPEPMPDASDEAWDVIVAEQVRASLEVLTDDERRAIETAYFGGYTYRQTAEMLETPEGTVKTRMRTGLRKLRDALEEKGVVRPWNITT